MRLISTILTDCAACMAPVAMILTLFVIAGYEIKSLLKVKQTYIVAVLRLIVFPPVFCVRGGVRNSRWHEQHGPLTILAMSL